MPGAEAERCSECGFSWGWAVEDAIGMVAASPPQFAHALARTATAGEGSSGGRRAVELLWHLVEALRLGTERLWSLTYDPGGVLPAYDADEIARVRASGARSAAVGMAAFSQAVEAWVGAARAVPPGSRAGAVPEGTLVSGDVIRGNAHDAQHRLLELERMARDGPGRSSAARPAAADDRPYKTADAPRLFDDYVMVDWSANSTPRTGRDSIWIASGSWRDGALVSSPASNPDTRHAASAQIERTIDTSLAGGRRVLVGFDFPLAYPAGLAAMFPEVFGGGSPWRAVWRTLCERIEDEADNANNRWEVAASLNRDTRCRLFWGCPSNQAGPYLAVNDKPVPGLADEPRPDRFRATERRARGVGGSIQSVWKLAYAGSVGSQALLGIPRVEALRARYGDLLRIWPLESGIAAEGIVTDVPVTVVEIWPTIFPTDWTRHPVRDAAQVLQCVVSCAQADEDGRMADWLAPDIAPATPEEVAEEGWILGVV